MKLLNAAMVLGLCVIRASAQDALKVDVLSGQDAVVIASAGRGADVRVRVVDAERRPVEGATVSAILPAVGIGGHFRGGSTIATERTDSRGEAEFRGIRLRNLTGDFTTRILARSGERTGTVAVTQKVFSGESAAPKEGWRSRRRLIMLGVAGAGVAAGIVAATYGGGSSAPAVGLTVTPGTPVTTGPR